MVIAEAARNHLRKAHQHGVDCGTVGGVDRKSIFVADGFRPAAFADLGIEPAAGVFAAGLAGERETPLAETLAQEMFVELGEVADFTDAAGVQILFGDLADAGDFSHIEWGEKLRFATGDDP